ncbi:MAG: CvpA family protein [Sulfurimonas sp.]|jgi:membrane protein required for colicin V production|nr:CvpA family protein [Sulfurimonas sp.]
MEFNYFDLVVSIVILLLGLKGIINGFFKEIFGLIGIIGGIFIASRVGDSVGKYLSDLIFKFDNTSAISFTGFLATLAIFWLLMIAAGMLFKKLSSLSGLGAVDKLLGFVFGASKFFLIAAVIAHAVYNIKAVRNTVDDMMSTSVVFPILVETGSVIMKLDPVEISDEINATIDKSTKSVEESLVKAMDNSTKEMIQSTKEEIQKSLQNKDNNETLN